MLNSMLKRGFVIGIIFLFIAITISSVSGIIISKNIELKEQKIIDEKEISLISGDDVEIYIYAGDKSDNPAKPSYGIVITMLFYFLRFEVRFGTDIAL